ncbi:hypothetical protein BX666DRAFT_1229951 [Dichotomocladium elegans]|nr:hypothetical protein BX666DRAFT_1229951 [Dichotomocladium elegans]
MRIDACPMDHKPGIVSTSPEVMRLANDLGFTYYPTVPDSFEDVHCLVVDSCSWSEVDGFLEKYIDNTPDLLKCVVMPSDPSFLQPDTLWAGLVPHQSCMTRNGESVEVSKSVSLVCVYFHEGSTRRDAACTFSADDIKSHGCNGAILAWHYLAEIGHKLGFVPKYDWIERIKRIRTKASDALMHS